MLSRKPPVLVLHEDAACFQCDRGGYKDLVHPDHFDVSTNCKVELRTELKHMFLRVRTRLRDSQNIVL